MPDDDDDLDAGETTLPLECPPGYALSRSAPPALDSSLVKRHIMLRRRLGMGEGLHHATGAGPDAPEPRLQGANRANRCYAKYEASPREVHCR